MGRHQLSKSTFIKGLQCEKALYYHEHQKELRDVLSISQEAIFDQGTSIGLLAQQLFPGGADCSPESYYDFEFALLKTQEEIHKGTKIIYEAAFQFNGVLAVLDILVKHEDGWRAFEVKSSTAVSETYELDASIQYYCITNSTIELKDISIVHINNQYVKNGPLNIHELFIIHSVLEKVQLHLPKIPSQINHLKNVLRKEDEPIIDIGPHCHYPFKCDFSGHCWKHVPDYSIFNIARLSKERKFDLYNKKIMHFQDVPDDFPLNENQWKQVKGELNNEIYINQSAVRDFVKELNYPIYHLDFETFATAVPIFDESRPYQQLVFQYSLHIEHANGQLEHREYLAEANGVDPRIQFIEQLIQDCGAVGDILVYNIAFEKGKLDDLMAISSRHKVSILKIIERLKDLMLPFRQRWYYHPKMKGSYSIKKVLPALIPELSYNDLNIKDGGTASNIFSQMIQGTYAGNIQETRKDLLDYCGMDTYAMVKILEVLKKL